MRVAIGVKSPSGWAALIAIGGDHGVFAFLDRRRIELAEDSDDEWAAQPFHAADGKPAAQARAIVENGIAAAQRCATRELRAAHERLRDDDHVLVACAVIVPAPMPAWSVEEILDVHLRMHQAGGALYPDGRAHSGAAARRQTAARDRAGASRRERWRIGHASGRVGQSRRATRA